MIEKLRDILGKFVAKAIILFFGSIRCVVGIIPLNDEEILMVKFGKEYGLPGGIVKHNETLEKAIKREIKEETGLEIKKIKKIYTNKSLKPPKTTTLFEIGEFKGKLKRSWEGKPISVKINDLPKKLRKTHKEYIELWMKNKDNLKNI